MRECLCKLSNVEEVFEKLVRIKHCYVFVERGYDQACSRYRVTLNQMSDEHLDRPIIWTNSFTNTSRISSRVSDTYFGIIHV